MAASFEDRVAAKVAEGRWSDRQARVVVRAAIANGDDDGSGLLTDTLRWDDMREGWVPKD